LAQERTKQENKREKEKGSGPLGGNDPLKKNLNQLIGDKSRYRLMGRDFEFEAENLIDQVKHCVSYVQYKWYYSVYSNIQKSLIWIFGRLL
jgi:hypothetical protein